MSVSHEEAASHSECGEPHVKPGIAATPDITRVAIGRPSLSAESGESPIVHARVPKSLKDALKAIAEQEHRKESDVIRDALTGYVQGRLGATTNES